MNSIMYPLPHKTQFVNEPKPTYSFVPEYKNISLPKELAYDFYEALQDFEKYSDIGKSYIIGARDIFRFNFNGNHQLMIARQKVGGLFADEYACLVINPNGNFIFTFDNDDIIFERHRQISPYVRTVHEKQVLLEIGRKVLNSQQYLYLSVTLSII